MPVDQEVGKYVLAIDLGTGAIATPALDPRARDYFIGGRGLGLYLLHRAITSDTTAGDPANPLIVANGPLGGIPQFPGTAKAMACGRTALLRGHPSVGLCCAWTLPPRLRVVLVCFGDIYPVRSSLYNYGGKLRSAVSGTLPGSPGTDTGRFNLPGAFHARRTGRVFYPAFYLCQVWLCSDGN